MRLLFLTFLLIAKTQAFGADAEYETRLIQWGLSLHQREMEASPEGKNIEEILYATENVFASTDPYPLWLNSFHVRTREHVFSRELLVTVGTPYREDLVRESERNLRRLYILAIARMVPVRGKQGGVALLVITKDRWSLRLNSDFNWVGPLLQYLRLQPTEQNLLGYNQQLSVDFQLRLDTWTLGQVYQAQRFSRFGLLAGQTAAIVVNRQTQLPEGWLGAAVFGRPLRNLNDTWGVLVSVDGRERIRRIFRGATVWALPFPNEATTTSNVPYIYNERVLNWEGALTRSFGRPWKLDVNFGLGGFSRHFAPPKSEKLSETESSWLVQNYLPRSEGASFLFASMRFFQADFKVLRDIDTFELSEDFQFGPSLFGIGRWAKSWWFSPQDFAEVGVSFRYRWMLGQDILTTSLAGSARHFTTQNTWVNRRLALEVINISPKVWGGRFVTRAMAELRRFDLDNRQQLLGGGNGLRGAVAESLSGPNMVLANLEYRTKSWEIFTVYVGGVLFYDAGAAFLSTPAFTHTVGGGLRILLPQWNQETIRIDFGWVLNGPSPLSIDRLSGSYGQVTDYRSSLFGAPLN